MAYITYYRNILSIKLICDLLIRIIKKIYKKKIEIKAKKISINLKTRCG